MQPSHALMIGTTGDRGRSSRAQERPPWDTLGGDNILHHGKQSHSIALAHTAFSNIPFELIFWIFKKLIIFLSEFISYKKTALLGC